MLSVKDVMGEIRKEQSTAVKELKLFSTEFSIL